MKYIQTDGGRANAGYKGSTGDCVIRAIAVATSKDYKDVYNDIFESQKLYAETHNNKTSRGINKYGASPRRGVFKPVFRKYLEDMGWKYVSGNRTLDCDDFKNGTFICSVRKHMTVVKEGTLYDSYDCQMTSGILNFEGEYIPPKVRTAFHHYVKVGN